MQSRETAYYRTILQPYNKTHVKPFLSINSRHFSLTLHTLTAMWRGVSLRKTSAGGIVLMIRLYFPCNPQCIFMKSSTNQSLFKEIEKSQIFYTALQPKSPSVQKCSSKILTFSLTTVMSKDILKQKCGKKTRTVHRISRMPSETTYTGSHVLYGELISCLCLSVCASQVGARGHVWKCLDIIMNSLHLRFHFVYSI